MKVVFDVGANVGDWTMQYLDHAPHADFFCFEPATETFRTLEQRTKGRRRVHPIHAAVGNRNETATLYHSEMSVRNSLVTPQLDPSHYEREEIEVLALDGFADANGLRRVDLLKTDTEGFDEQVLLGAHSLLAGKRIDFVLAEVNFAKGDASISDFDAITSTLDLHGYRPVGFYDTHLWGPPWFIFYLNVLYTCL